MTNKKKNAGVRAKSIDAKIQSAMDKAANKVSARIARGRPRHVKGKGGFWDDMKGFAQKVVPKGALKALGHSIHPLLGHGADYLSEAHGIGDYEIKKNSIIHFDAGQDSGGSFSPEGTARVRIQKREFITSVVADATTPGDFHSWTYRLQPTNGTTFPWTSAIADHFTEYTLCGAILEYESTSSNYSNSMALGTVGIATQYNANELPLTSMESILQSAFHSRGNPSTNILHGVECDPMLQSSEKLYTRRPGTQGPPNLYDWGVITLATEGLPSLAAGQVIGRLYITYDLELALPVLPVEAPYASQIGVGYQQSLPILYNQPPMGDLLTCAGEVGFPLTFGATPDDNIILMQAASGPVVKPTLTPLQESNLVGWMNNSTINTNLQYLSLTRAGRYMVEMMYISWGATGVPPVGAFVATALPGASLTSTYQDVSNNASYGECKWFLNIDVTIPGASIELLNVDANPHSATLSIYTC